VSTNVAKQAWFIPGRPGTPEGPLARYRPVQPSRAAGAYVRRLTQPGDLVVDLFCQGPTIVRETAATGRRALGASVNPLLVAIARLGLCRRDADALKAAFTHLADSPKGDVALHQHMADLYRSACPACGALGIAEWFAWDRDGNYPFQKAVRCSRCEAVTEGAVDEADAESARRIHPRGLAYYTALDRVAPTGHPARGQTAELVGLYTPRNLAALMDVVMRLETPKPDEVSGEAVTIALTAALLECFDAGSSLDPYGEKRPRPRTLRIPPRYLERNIWLCLEQSLGRLMDEESGPPRSEDGSREAAPEARDIAAMVRGEEAGYALVNRSAREVGEIVPPGSVALIFADPPRPDGVFWALSALWAGWLWESSAIRALSPFLRRRRFDWGWHRRVLQAALRAVAPLLTPEGHLVTLFSDHDNVLLESVCLAASGAGYALEGWGYSQEAGHRIVWRWEDTQLTPPGDWEHGAPYPQIETLKHELTAEARASVVSTVQARGEPTRQKMLRSSAYTHLATCGALGNTAAIPEDGDAPSPLALAAGAVDSALDDGPLVQVSDQEDASGELWWLADAAREAEPVARQVETPLADRVETQVRSLLGERQAWALEELEEAVYARFPGPLTPGSTLVSACVESYSVHDGAAVRLRPEDAPGRRAGELDALRRDLAELGKRLGFEIGQRGDWDVRWLAEGQEAYVFSISATAVLGPHLLARRTTDESAQRCLVVPGGRARLVGLKLQRDPRLARAVEIDGWQFVKFRHLRRLLGEEELDRHALKTVLGLDPIAEQEAAQIPLF